MKDDITVNELSTEPTGIRRRTLVAGTAWAIPAVAVVGAAPAFATSPVCDNTGVICIGAGTACKHTSGQIKGERPAGNQGDTIYHLTFSYCNKSSSSVQVCVSNIDMVTSSDQHPTFSLGQAPGYCINVDAHSCKTVTFHSDFAPNAANGAVTVTYTVGTSTTNQKADFNVGTLNPCDINYNDTGDCVDYCWPAHF